MTQGDAPVRVMVAGLGNMGRSHALAYAGNPGFEIVGLVDREPVDLADGLAGYGVRNDFHVALGELRPDLCAIATYSDSHADYATAAMEAGSHVFVEKPLATTLDDAQRVVDCAKANGRKLVVGYILRHHPSWVKLIAEARALGGPYVFRMNLNQQSSGPTWATHKQLLRSTPPIVDCGVHYVDAMCQITDARPIQVHGIGVRLSDEVAEDMYNYGQLQVLFEDGSVGWYEAGWGPMMSETAFFVKDIISPNGSVSIVHKAGGATDNYGTHTKTGIIRRHSAETGTNGQFARDDEDIDMADEPDHQELCDREQAFVLKAIRADLDLDRHMHDAVLSLRICLAADVSVRERRAVAL